MNAWLAIVGVGVVTFLARASFIVLADPRRFPPAFRAALAFVPPAVLAAIVAPGLAWADGALDLTGGNVRWIAGIAAFAVALRTRSTVATVIAGMAALWLLRLW